MTERIFGDREKALEDAYMREQDAKLLQKLRDKAHLDEIAAALGEKLRVDDPALLLKANDLGVNLDTAAAFFLGPLVQVAWADGTVSRQSHDAVLHQARQRGIAEASPAYAQLEAWLKQRPSRDFFDTAIEVLKAGFAVLTPPEREERIKALLKGCHDVADPPAVLEHIIGRSEGISHEEAATIEQIGRALRG